MAIVGERIENTEEKTITRRFFGDQTVASARGFRHDRRTYKQLACRAPMRFAKTVYYVQPPAVIDQWKEVHPMDFFCEAVKRWIAGYSPAVSPYYPVNTPSELTISATATAAGGSILLTFTPSAHYALWGVAIIRSTEPIETPDTMMLRIIYPLKAAVKKTLIDSPKKPGTYHYRFAACEITGKRGEFSPDISATIP
jgi:hypothetical protein